MRVRLSKVLLTLAGLALAGAAGIAVTGMSGWYNPAALDPHPSWVSRFIEMALREGVQHYARDVEPPPLGDESLANRAAGHFANRCEGCHGAPGIPRDQQGQAMYPVPPDLAIAVPDWTPGELYWVLENGIKLSGMPAWGPTHRGDELWALVAFILRLPDMSADEYRRVTDAAPGPSPGPSPGRGADIVRAGVPSLGLTACARCHGLDGTGLPEGGIPRLAGLDADYVAHALDSYASGFRRSGIMGPIASALTLEGRRAVAEYYAGIDGAPFPPPPVVAEELLERGARLAAEGAPDRRIPACASCHGGFRLPPVDGIPDIAGQFADYMELQFHLWRTGQRGAAPHAGIMQRLALLLDEREIEAVSAFYAGLRGETGRPARE